MYNYLNHKIKNYTRKAARVAVKTARDDKFYKKLIHCPAFSSRVYF